MGQAIVYCGGCQARLLETDFEKRKAVRVGEIPYCQACAPPQVVEPEPSSGAIRSLRPRTGGTEPSGAGIWIAAAAGILVLVGIVAAGVRTTRPPSPPPPPPEPPPMVVLPEPAPPPPSPPVIPKIEPPKPEPPAPLVVPPRPEPKPEPPKPEPPPAVVAPAPPPPPPPPPAPTKHWEIAMALAAARDFPAAVAELEAAKDLEPDLQIVKQLATLHAETAQAIAKWPRDQKLALDVVDRGKVEGLVTRADAFRVELSTAEGPAIVPFGEIAPASWGELFKNRRTRKPGDSRTAAIYCLLEGDVEAARKMKGEPAPPEKYWGYAAAPPSPREAEARRLFQDADAGACATLLKDFAETAVVRRNHAMIAALAQGGREYFLVPENLVATGAFRWTRTARREAFWQSSADNDGKNIVTLEFVAHPDLEYKASVFVGGCCADTLTFAMRNGDEPAVAVPHAVTTVKHSAHKGPREAAHWGWVTLPPIKGSGARKIHLLPEKHGFAVAYAWVTALNRPPPRESEFRALEQARAATPGDRTFLRDPRQEPGLIGYWRFDEGAGASTADASKVGNAGKLVGATWSKGALAFDGKDDAVVLARLPAAQDNFTMMFWAFPAAERKFTPESTDGISGTMDQRFAIFPTIMTGAGAGVSVGTNGISVFEHSGGYMPALLVHERAIAAWTHVAVVYSNRKPWLYVNGALAKEGMQSARAVAPGGAFGGLIDNQYGPYRGLLDEVRIYDRALTEAEISQLASKPRAISK